jgi:hypothetical protein
MIGFADLQWPLLISGWTIENARSLKGKLQLKSFATL